MAGNNVIVPSMEKDWAPVSLSLKQSTGKLFRKHILTKGPLRHPKTGKNITIDDKFVASLKQNFDNGICDIVQVPLANDKNEHSEDPSRNIGEVVGIEDDPKTGKVYALVDARDEKAKISLGKTYLGASAMMSLDYTDTATDEKVGPTLLHVAVTNRPYVTKLDPYTEVVAASAEYGSDEEITILQFASQEDSVAGKTGSGGADSVAELKARVKELEDQLADATDGDNDAEDQAEKTKVAASAAAEEARVELASQIATILNGTDDVNLSATEVTQDDVISAVAELANRNVVLSSGVTEQAERIQALERRGVESEVDALVLTGYIIPAKRDTYVDLALSNPALFEQLVPDEPIVELSRESGIAPEVERTGEHETDIDAEIARLTASDGPAARYVRGN